MNLLFITIGLCLWEWFQLSRLYFAFKPTIYAISRITLIFLIFIIIFQTSFDLALDVTENDKLTYWSFITAIIFTNCVTILFSIKLFKLALAMKQSFDVNYNYNITIENIDSDVALTQK